ncbi:MAG: RagB/SusD family nutrient uptake outer membrane protein [Proteiniphilum sp.]|nr:RagB/SusD family nutrient uptake outer membrane protein [Proteiniphilum sp.]
MKRFFLIATTMIFLLSCITSCVDLNITPTTILTGEAIYNEAGVRAYMAGMYNQLPMEDFKYSTNNMHGARNGYFSRTSNAPLWGFTGEMVTIDTNSADNNKLVTGYWTEGFKIIRQANTLIEDLPNYPALSDQSKAWIAEAKFIRAYMYFKLAQRYGGLPKILKPQYLDPNDASSVWVARETHADTYDFILKDLDDAIADMPESSEAGRANKYVAAALKSRIALFAATTARYGSYKFQDWEVEGVLLQGIPETLANGYFKQAWDAAKIFDNGPYELHRGNPDKTANYAEIWEKVESNKESIWLRKYDFTNYVHSHDCLMAPIRMVAAYGSRGGGPTLDWIELFEGVPLNSRGHFSAFDQDGNFLVYDNSHQLFDGFEPRLKANLLIPGYIYCSVKLDIRAGIIDKKFDPAVDKFKKFTIDDGENSASLAASYNQAAYTVNPFSPPNDNSRIVWWTTADPLYRETYDAGNGIKLYKTGLDGPTMGTVTSTSSGFHVRKYLDINLPIERHVLDQSTQPWIEIRYAEVLLNRAEAAIELAQNGDATYGGINMLQDALECINNVRDRAGATLATLAELSTSPAYTNWSKPGLKGQGGFVEAPNRALQILRVERYKELAFESKIYWDLRRWFTFDTQINVYRRRMLLPFMFARDATIDVDNAGIPNGKYIYDSKTSEHRTLGLTFNVANYYEVIPDSELKNNPLLQKNRGQ